jgi:hypothetical protein
MSLQPEKLTKTDVFGQLSDSGREALARLTCRRMVGKGEILCD